MALPRQARDAGVSANPVAENAASAALTSTAAAGEASATISATSAGAVTTATSKVTAPSAYAASRSAGSSVSTVHRARIAAGSCGSVAPAQTAHSRSTQLGAPAWPATTSATSPDRWPAVTAHSTGPCPSRSISRPCATAPSALARPKPAATRPASANEPVVSRANSRIASTYMPIGIDPAVARISGTRTPGSPSRRR